MFLRSNHEIVRKATPPPKLKKKVSMNIREKRQWKGTKQTYHVFTNHFQKRCLKRSFWLIDPPATDNRSHAPTYRDILFDVLKETSGKTKSSVAAEHVVRKRISTFWNAIDIPTLARSNLVKRVQVNSRIK